MQGLNKILCSLSRAPEDHCSVEQQTVAAASVLFPPGRLDLCKCSASVPRRNWRIRPVRVIYNIHWHTLLIHKSIGSVAESRCLQEHGMCACATAGWQPVTWTFCVFRQWPQIRRRRRPSDSSSASCARESPGWVGIREHKPHLHRTDDDARFLAMLRRTSSARASLCSSAA